MTNLKTLTDLIEDSFLGVIFPEDPCGFFPPFALSWFPSLALLGYSQHHPGKCIPRLPHQSGSTRLGSPKALMRHEEEESITTIPLPTQTELFPVPSVASAPTRKPLLRCGPSQMNLAWAGILSPPLSSCNPGG